MARKLTAREALARAICCCSMGPHGWASEPALNRKLWRAEAKEEMRFLAELGFTIVPRKPTRKGRK